MHTLARHELHHADGRRLLVYGTLSGSLHDEPATEEPQAIHKRLDPFTETWVGIAPARNARPLDSAAETSEECPFCPGGSEVPFAYEAAVFDNRFPSFCATPPVPPALDWPTGPALGRCEVVLYTHRHEASFGRLSPTELSRVLAIWIDRARELWNDPAHAYVCVFENRGAEVGATIAHPHGQIYALDHVPPTVAAKAAAHRAHRERSGSCLSCDATGRMLAPTASSRTTTASSSRFRSPRDGRSRSPSEHAGTDLGAWPTSTRSSSATLHARSATSSCDTTRSSASHSRT